MLKRIHIADLLLYQMMNSEIPLNGQLYGEVVKLDKQAIEILYNTSFYGRPRGGILELSLIEAAYLLYRQKIEIEEEGEHLDFKRFVEIASTRASNFELKYIVYKDLRERGFFVQPSITGFRVYPRGGHPGKTPAKFFVYVTSERIPLSILELTRHLEAASNLKKRMVLAIVDEESDITFYEVKKAVMHGEGLAHPLPPGIFSMLLDDRVVVWEPEPSYILHNKGFYGNPLDEERLQLSLVESAYLQDKGLLIIRDRDGKIIEPEAFSSNAGIIEPEFQMKYQVYKNLRDSGLVVKTGFKFGTHFRAYKKIESFEKMPHSDYLIHVIPKDHIFSLQTLSRGVRLAHSVRKRMIFGVPEKEEVEYIDIGRIKL